MNRIVASLLVCITFTVTAACGAAVTVNRNIVLSTMPDEGIGVNMAVWYGNFNAPFIPSALTDAGVTVVRYPGGSYSDAYHFATNSGEGSDGNSNVSPIYVAPNTNFRNFMNLLTSGANPKDAIVAVDYGSSLKHTMGGQPQEAEAWVALANGNASLYGTPNDINIGVDAEGNNWGTVGYWAHLRTLSSGAAMLDADYNGTNPGTPAASLGNLSALAMGHAASYGIQNWEVGNELNGNGYLAPYWNWETDMHSTASGAAHVGDPALSPTAYGQNANAFALAMKAADPTIKVGVGLINSASWDPYVLQQAGAHIDFGIVHYYPYATDPSVAGTPATDTSFLMSRKDDISSLIAGTRNFINQNAGANAANIGIKVTEFGHFGNFADGKMIGLYTTEAFASFLETGVSNVDLWEMFNQGLYESLFADLPVQQNAAGFYGMKMMNLLAKPGDKFVLTNSSDQSILSHATVHADGKVELLLINAGADPVTTTISIDGNALRTDGILYSTNGGKAIQTTILNASLGNEFTITIPGRMMYEYVLTPVPEPSTFVLIALGMVGLARRLTQGRFAP